MIRADIVVAGAGVVGMAACLNLARAGLRVVCLSRDTVPAARPPAAADPWDLRVFALSAHSQSVLQHAAAWQHMNQSRIEAVRTMCVYPSAGISHPPVRFDAASTGLSVLASIVEQNNLLAGLAQAMADSPVRLLTGSLQSLRNSDDGDYLLLTSSAGQKIRCRLLVAADGAGSPARALSGIAVSQLSYGQRALVAHCLTARVHEGCAWQWFGEHGVLALLPLPDQHGASPEQRGRRASIVWSTDADQARQIESQSAAHLSDLLASICGDSVGQCDIDGPVASFELNELRAQSVIGDRVVLIGDAAHVVHPLAGQGLNLGLGDVAALAEVLGDARRRWRAANFDVGSALLLRRYRRRRAEPVLAMQSAIDGLARLFRPAPLPPPARAAVETVRDMGWRIVARNDALRRLLIKYASGGS